MNLVIDIGNTLTKLAIFRDDEIIRKLSVDNFDLDTLDDFGKSFPGIRNAILSSVKKKNTILSGHLKKSFDYFIELDCDTPLPIENNYTTPDTLGYDRLAAAVGAYTIFPDSNVLIIDIGSAITFDFINSENQYQGGNISPGMQMRFRALNDYTSNLPLVDLSDNPPVGGHGQQKPSDHDRGIGKTTTEAIRKGVQIGIANEIDGFIEYMKSGYPDLKTMVTGGDSSFFDNSLKNSIFVDLNLVLKGLNGILVYNA